MRKYIVILFYILCGCQGNTTSDDELAKNNPMAFSVLLAMFEQESAPDFDSNVLAYAKIPAFDDDSAGINPLPFNDIVTYFPKTASLILKHKKCDFYIIKQKKDNSNSFNVLHSISPEGALIYHFVPTTPKGDVCKAIRSVDYWAFLVEDCSRTLNQSIPIRYKTHESSSWKCDDVIPFNTQEEWISPSILKI